MPIKQSLSLLTKDLISFPSCSYEKEKNALILDYIKNFLSPEPVIISKYSKNGFKNLVITAQKPPKVFDLILHGHTDVVPPSLASDFKPRIKDNKIYGRGALDMKGGLAIMLILFKELIKNKNNKIALFITSDEEIGGRNGTGFLFKKLQPKAKFFITLEGDEKYRLKYEQKGILRFTLKVKGKSVHSSYSWLGENAVEKLFLVYQEIKRLFPGNVKDKHHWYTTVNVGTIKGGSVANAVPEDAEAIIDIRVADDWISPQNTVKAIKKIVERSTGIEMKEIKTSPITKISLDNPHLCKLNILAKKHLATQEDFYFKNPGTNDTRFAVEYGIPGVSFGPIGENFHAKNEYVSIESLMSVYTILEEFIT